MEPLREHTDFRSINLYQVMGQILTPEMRGWVDENIERANQTLEKLVAISQSPDTKEHLEFADFQKVMEADGRLDPLFPMFCQDPTLMARNEIDPETTLKVVTDMIVVYRRAYQEGRNELIIPPSFPAGFLFKEKKKRYTIKVSELLDLLFGNPLGCFYGEVDLSLADIEENATKKVWASRASKQRPKTPKKLTQESIVMDIKDEESTQKFLKKLMEPVQHQAIRRFGQMSDQEFRKNPHYIFALLAFPEFFRSKKFRESDIKEALLDTFSFLICFNKLGLVDLSEIFIVPELESLWRFFFTRHKEILADESSDLRYLVFETIFGGKETLPNSLMNILTKANQVKRCSQKVPRKVKRAIRRSPERQPASTGQPTDACKKREAKVAENSRLSAPLLDDKEDLEKKFSRGEFEFSISQKPDEAQILWVHTGRGPEESWQKIELRPEVQNYSFRGPSYKRNKEYTVKFAYGSDQFPKNRSQEVAEINFTYEPTEKVASSPTTSTPSQADNPPPSADIKSDDNASLAIKGPQKPPEETLTTCAEGEALAILLYEIQNFNLEIVQEFVTTCFQKVYIKDSRALFELKGLEKFFKSSFQHKDLAEALEVRNKWGGKTLCVDFEAKTVCLRLGIDKNRIMLSRELFFAFSEILRGDLSLLQPLAKKQEIIDKELDEIHRFEHERSKLFRKLEEAIINFRRFSPTQWQGHAASYQGPDTRFILEKKAKNFPYNYPQIKSLRTELNSAGILFRLDSNGSVLFELKIPDKNGSACRFRVSFREDFSFSLENGTRPLSPTWMEEVKKIGRGIMACLCNLIIEAGDLPAHRQADRELKGLKAGAQKYKDNLHFHQKRRKKAEAKDSVSTPGKPSSSRDLVSIMINKYRRGGDFRVPVYDRHTGQMVGYKIRKFEAIEPDESVLFRDFALCFPGEEQERGLAEDEIEVKNLKNPHEKRVVQAQIKRKYEEIRERLTERNKKYLILRIRATHGAPSGRDKEPIRNQQVLNILNKVLAEAGITRKDLTNNHLRSSDFLEFAVNGISFVDYFIDCLEKEKIPLWFISEMTVEKSDFDQILEGLPKIEAQIAST